MKNDELAVIVFTRTSVNNGNIMCSNNVILFNMVQLPTCLLLFKRVCVKNTCNESCLPTQEVSTSTHVNTFLVFLGELEVVFFPTLLPPLRMNKMQ